MKATHRSRLAAAVAATGASALALGSASLPATAFETKPEQTELESQAGQEDQADDDGYSTRLLEPRSSAAEALKQLEDFELAAVAQRAGMTTDRLTSHLAEERALVSPSGFVTLVDEWDVSEHEGHPHTAAAEVPGDPVGGSRPGASHTIFIDFDGATVEDTEWNAARDVETIEISPYDVSDDFKRTVWETVAQDYAPFDVNVTIADPGPDALHKTSEDDDEYGAHLVIAPDKDELPEAMRASGGWAFVGTFGMEYASPAFVVADNVGDNPYFIGDAASHEVGHTLGLEHHGIVNDEYYYHETPASPEALWGPIMGAPYTVPLTQWSNGGYEDATNPGQDDIAVMTDADFASSLVILFDQDGNVWSDPACTDADNPESPQPGDMFWKPGPNEDCNPPGAELEPRWDYAERTQHVSDPHGDSMDEASSLDNASGEFADEGLIVSEDDADVFTFVTNGGQFTAQAAPVGNTSNLDVKLTLLDSEGDVVADNEQTTGADPAGYPLSPRTLGLDVSLDEELEVGVYYLKIEGRGQGDPAENTPENGSGYTSYGSLGRYELTGAAEPFDAEPVVITSPEDGAEVEASNLQVNGTAEPEAEVSLTVGDDAAGNTTADAEGNWSATLEDDLPYGDSEVTAQQTVGDIEVTETDSVTVSVPLPAPVITKPEEGDTANSSTPTFTGTGVPGATVTLAINCADDFSLTTDADSEVDDDGNWSFTPDNELPNGDCSVEALQSIGDTHSESAGSVNFSVDVKDSGDEEGSEDGGEGAEEGDEDGGDLPDTGAGNLAGLGVGALLLAIGATLYARTRRASV